MENRFGPRVPGTSSFPLAAMERAMALRGKSLAVTEALIEDVLTLEYGKARTFAVLAILFSHIDTRNLFHVDHVFPAAKLEKKELASHKADDGTPKFTAEETSTLISLRNRLPNLELLPGLENIGKSDKAPDGWLAAEYPSVGGAGPVSTPFIIAERQPVRTTSGPEPFTRRRPSCR